MADNGLREKERRWRESPADGEAAAAYLAALDRTGLLPGQTCRLIEPPTNAPIIRVLPVFGRGQRPLTNAIEVEAGGVGVLFSYSSPVAARIPGREPNAWVWCPNAAYSNTSRKHVSQWGPGRDDMDEVDEETLRDLIRLVPLADLQPEEPEPVTTIPVPPIPSTDLEAQYDEPQPDDGRRYQVVRFYQDESRRPYRRRVIERGLTLSEAQEHCEDPERSSTTATKARGRKRTEAYGRWFDGYEEE